MNASMLSLWEIVRQHRAACNRHKIADEMATPQPDRFIERRAEAAMDSLSDEMRAWVRLGLACSPETLEDAAIQLGLLFDFFADIAENDLADQLKTRRLERGLHDIQRILSGITVCVARQGGVDLDQVGEEGLLSRVQARVPLPMANGEGQSTAAEGSPDAQLLEAYQRLLAGQGGLDALIGDESPDRDERQVPFLDITNDASACMQKLQAKTLDGLKAKADALRLILEQQVCLSPNHDGRTSIATIDEDGSWQEQFAWSLARDVLAMGRIEA